MRFVAMATTRIFFLEIDWARGDGLTSLPPFPLSRVRPATEKGVSHIIDTSGMDRNSEGSAFNIHYAAYGGVTILFT